MNTSLNKWITLKNEWFKPFKENATRFSQTGEQEGTIHMDIIKTVKGQCGEVREWEDYTSDKGETIKLFGNYSEKRWYEFLKDIQTNGIKESIIIDVEEDGSHTVYEGNHRIQAALQLGLSEVPVLVRYYKNGQFKYKF